MNKVLLSVLKITVFTTVIAFSTFSATAQVLDGLTQTASKTPTLAYSLRKLKAAYTGPAVRVRSNASSPEFRDVYFDSNGLVSLNSPVSAAGGGVSTATTLSTWIGSGTCFITIWYDQSGNSGRDATNPAAVQLVSTSTLTTNGTTTITLGTAMANYTVYDLQTNAATTNNSLKMAAAPSTTITKMAITGTGIPDGTFAQTSAATTTTTKVVNVASGATFRAYALNNTYQPGNMLVDANGKIIGIIKSIESATSMTLQSAAPESKTYLASEWGMATQPTLVKDGAVEFIPNTSMPAMRVYNGANSNTRFIVPNYVNDAGGTSNNLANVKNLNLFTITRSEGNLAAGNGQTLFGTYYSSPIDAKLSFIYNFSSTFVGNYRSYSAAGTVGAINSGGSSTGIVTAVGRFSIVSDATTNTGTVYSSAGTTSTPKTGILPVALDATQIQLLGQSNGGTGRNFEGLASEMIFYGTTTTTDWDETDAVALYNNEALAFVNGPTIIDPTVTSVTATSATIGANVAAGGATAVTARGTYYGTTASPAGNGATTAGTTGAFTRNVTGLTSNTKYYYRGYATNTAGTNYSVDGSFTTLPAMPTADAPSDITSTGFTAHWTAPVQGTEAFTYRFHYTTSAAWSGGTSTTGIVSSDVSRVITGLTPNTVYYYRLRCDNASGSGMFSNPGQSLTTLPAAPTVAAASAVTASGFTANWTAPTQGAETFTYTVEYGASSDLSSGTTLVTSISSGNLSSAIAALAASTTYYYRVKAVNTQGAGAWSEIQSVTTAAPTVISPVVNASDLSLAPGAVVSVQNNGHLNLNQPTDVYSITVEAGGKLTNTSTLNATNIILKNTATGSATYLDNGTTNLTSANVQQELATGRNWYVSSPVAAATVSSVNSITGSTMVYYDEVHGSTNPWPTMSGSLTPGKGYISLSPIGAQPVNVQLNGALNNGDMPPVTLTRTSGQTKEGFNLVGNPYPSYINWTEAIANASNVLPTIWYRTKASGLYTFYTYNSVADVSSPSTEGLTSYIPPLQAFWVRVKTVAGGTLTFTNNMRSHADVNSNMLKVRSSVKTVQQVLRLQVSNGQNKDEAVIVFNPEASDAFDNYDSPKMSNGNAAIPEIYSTVGSENLVINGMSAVPYNTELSLGFSTGQSNAFTFKATEMSNFESRTRVILKDKLANTEQELEVDAPYTFTSGAVNTSARFSLIFRAPGVSTLLDNKTEAPIVLVYQNENKQLTINCQQDVSAISHVAIYNAIGQKLISKPLTTSITVIDQPLIAGVYFVTVSNGGKISTKKVILN